MKRPANPWRHSCLLAGVAACIGSGLARADPAAPALTADIASPLACQPPVQRHADGGLALCTLSRAQDVSRRALPAGTTIWLSPLGRLTRARLGEAAPVQGLVLPAGTELFFAADGRLRHFWLPHDTVLQGHLVRAQDDGAGNQLHPSGALRAISLAGDQVIDGIPCSSSGSVWRMGLGVVRLGTRRMAWFHENGRLRQAMLGKDVVIEGQAFKAGTVVGFTADGRLDPQAPVLSDW